MRFAAGVFMAHTTQTQAFLIDTLAIVFVRAHIVFLLCNWADRAWQRTLLLMLSPTFKTLLV